LSILLKNNFNVKYLQQSTKLDNQTFPAGTLCIDATKNFTDQQLAVKSKIESMGFKFTSIQSIEGISMKKLKLPKVGMLVGQRINAYEAGDIWFAMDQEFGMNVIHLDIDRINRLNLESYDILILPDGNYSGMSESLKNKINSWLEKGGQIIAFRKALKFLNTQQFIQLINTPNQASKLKKESSNQSGAKVLGGAIFETEMNLEHPLGFGYGDEQFHIFKRGTQFYELTENKKASPLKYTASPLVSGYMHKSWETRAKNATSVSCFGKGEGRIIAFVDNPLFRGYWLGGLKLFANSLFFGGDIDPNLCQY